MNDNEHAPESGSQAEEQAAWGARPPRLPVPDASPENPEGSNATIHHPDDRAPQHPVRPERRRDIGPYTTGNY
ncbi:MAG TPA: hypothetical protein VIL30_19955 [Ramlibacter sp.]|jgi:hypothetical protein